MLELPFFALKAQIRLLPVLRLPFSLPWSSVYNVRLKVFN